MTWDGDIEVRTDLWEQTAWVQIPDQPLNSSVLVSSCYCNKLQKLSGLNNTSLFYSSGVLANWDLGKQRALQLYWEHFLLCLKAFWRFYEKVSEASKPRDSFLERRLGTIECRQNQRTRWGLQVIFQIEVLPLRIYWKLESTESLTSVTRAEIGSGCMGSIDPNSSQ